MKKLIVLSVLVPVLFLTSCFTGWEEVSFKNENKHGGIIWHYDNGNTSYNRYYKGRREHGEFIRYGKNGKTIVRSSYRDGKRQGEFTKNYKNRENKFYDYGGLINRFLKNTK